MYEIETRHMLPAEPEPVIGVVSTMGPMSCVMHSPSTHNLNACSWILTGPASTNTLSLKVKRESLTPMIFMIDPIK